MKRGFVSRKSFFALLVILLVLVLGALPAVASPVLEPNVCPSGDGWVKFDGLSGFTYSYSAPAGKLIDGWCWKAGSTREMGRVIPPASSYTIDITGNQHELSHVAFHLTDKPCDPCTSTIRVPQEPLPPGKWSEFGECIDGFKTRSRTVTTPIFIMGIACGRPHEKCGEGVREEIEYEREECPPEPGKVIVGASFGCGSPDEDGVVWQLMGKVTVSPFGGAVLTLNGWDYEGSHGAHLPFGSYSWSAVANAGYEIVGDSEGSFQITRADCNEEPKEHPPTGPDSALTLPVAVGVVGLALMAMGAKLAFKREE